MAGGLALAERLVEVGVSLDVARGDGDVVEVARGGPAGGELLRAVLEVVLGLLGRRLVALDLPEDLVKVPAVWRAIPEGAPVPAGAFDPADGLLGVAQALGDGLGIAGTVGAPRDVADLGLGALGDHEARMQPLRPAAQVDRLAVAGRLFEPEDVDHPADGLLRPWADELDMCELGQQDL